MKSSKTLFLLAFLITVSCIVLSCNIEPYEGEVPEENIELSCEEAIQNTTIAATNFATASNNTDYFELCNAYKKALEDQIVSCGDEGGNLQLVLDAIGDCEGAVGNPFPGTNENALMTAIINGEAFNDLKPNAYLFFGEAIGFNGFFSRSDDDYIELQGNSTYTTPTLIEANTIEINIFIPSAYWKTGTFVMYDENTDVATPEIYYTFLTFDRPNNIDQEEITGEIIINKFSREDRVIQGTFEFEYKLINTDDNSEEGPFTVTGTFDYALDHETFD